MKANKTISIDVDLIVRVESRIGKGNVSGLIETLLKNWETKEAKRDLVAVK